MLLDSHSLSSGLKHVFALTVGYGISPYRLPKQLADWGKWLSFTDTAGGDSHPAPRIIIIIIILLAAYLSIQK